MEGEIIKLKKINDITEAVVEIHTYGKEGKIELGEVEIRNI